ncbi:MAG: hypothetical protein IKP38_06140 [Clostridia bacterium]|nr:hypothetical protein [Clostridia bacterium]
MKTDSITGGDHHAMRKLNEREHRLLDLAKERMEYKDQILFIVFAAIKYAFVEDLIFFLEDEPNAASEDVIGYVIGMTHECQAEAEKNSNS